MGRLLEDYPVVLCNVDVPSKLLKYLLIEFCSYVAVKQILVIQLSIMVILVYNHLAILAFFNTTVNRNNIGLTVFHIQLIW